MPGTVMLGSPMLVMMKQYITTRKYRAIPVGYAATDLKHALYETAAYLNCGPDEVRADYVAFNDYSWCGNLTFSTSSWAEKVKRFSSFDAPILSVQIYTNEMHVD
jgi:hypothetical protein